MKTFWKAHLLFRYELFPGIHKMRVRPAIRSVVLHLVKVCHLKVILISLFGSI